MSALDFYRNPDLADGFGSTKGGRLNAHNGLDFPHGLGVVVPALAPGIVTHSQWHPGLGHFVQVRQDDGLFAGYRHLRSAAPRVSAGTRVKYGDYIGQVSDTGSWANGYHLCTTISRHPEGVFGYGVVDPWPWIQFYALGGSNPAPPAPKVSGFVKVPGGGNFFWPTGDLMKRMQKALAKKKRYNFANGSARPADGIGGDFTALGVQLTLNHSGRFGGISVPNHSQKSLLDARLATGAAWGIQEYARDFGDYKGPQDGDPRAQSWAGFALGLERP